MARNVKDYKSNVTPVWCPGCGDYAVLNSLMRAFAELDLPNENIVMASGIGCSSRIPAFAKTYGIHGVHGRPLPLATGIKLANPDLTVIALGGDGDGFSIGAGHFPHAARRNVGITYVVMDNSIYGMTKGQPSPTSPEGIVRKVSPYGALERPLNPVLMALAYESGFVARAFAGKPKELTAVLKEAMQYPGFAFVQVLSPCVTFNDTYEHYREITQLIPEAHDPTNLVEAMRLASITDTQYLGIFYRDNQRASYEQRIKEMQARAPQMTTAKILNSFRR